MNHKLLLRIIGFGLAILLGWPRPVAGQAGGEVVETRVEHRFGEEIRFFARIRTSVPVLNATVTFGIPGERSQIGSLSLHSDGTATFRYDAQQNLLPPFSRIVYRFDFTLSDGTQFSSSTQEYVYTDNRFAWQERSDSRLRVHWYAGDAAFGAFALDVAQRGLEAARRLVPMNLEAPIDIYIYASPIDLQSALALGGQGWVAGHANPKLGTVLVAIEPGTDLRVWLERQIPHELTHVLLYRMTGINYDRLPVWLREGMAMNAELYPNPDFEAALRTALETNSLLSMTELCTAFPPDTGRAFVAYAQSQSFVRFLIEQYGVTGLFALITAYADGMDCETGARRALEQPLSTLERRWREIALGENRAHAVFINLFPYLLILGLILVIPLWGTVGYLLGHRTRQEIVLLERLER